MSPSRPDLVECFVFRMPDGAIEPEFLLVRRAPRRAFPGLWQPVTGGLDPAERVPACALREVGEETGIGPPDIVGFYDLDQVTHFYDEGSDGVVAGAIFALQVRPETEPRISEEHDGLRWASADEARELIVWPSYRESIARILANLLEPARARWFELDLEGRRLAR